MKSHKQEYIVVDYNDLEDEVKAAWGHEWSFPLDHLSGNDVEHSFTVEPHVDDYNAKAVAEFKMHGVQTEWKAQAILNELCREGRIEPGEYLIRVSW